MHSIEFAHKRTWVTSALTKVSGVLGRDKELQSTESLASQNTVNPASNETPWRWWPFDVGARFTHILVPCFAMCVFMLP